MSEQPAVASALKKTPAQRFEVYKQSGRHLALAKDAIAGLIVALIAIPLGVGFAIASGLQPEQGIIAGALAGILGGLFGGSKYQVYGPTAAFIPLLSGIISEYDVPFLIMASVLAGLIIVMMGLFRLGEHFSRIPFSITVGFTIGIAMSIAFAQLPDALGTLQPVTGHAWEKAQLVGKLLMQPNFTALSVAFFSYFIIKVSYKVSVFIPGPLIVIMVATILDQTLLGSHGLPLISDKFGAIGNQMFQLTLPAVGARPVWSLALPVLSIVFIAALESLLSARMADRLANSRTPFNPNRELLGQGVVNTLVPLMNGFPCTGAFARTATNIKAGAGSPAASLFQGGFIILLMCFFSGGIALIPMACISGLLIYVAFSMVKMAEIRHVLAEGRWHAFLMIYTALLTFWSDLLIAVSSATALYYLLPRLKKSHLLSLMLAVLLVLPSMSSG